MKHPTSLSTPFRSCRVTRWRWRSTPSSTLTSSTLSKRSVLSTTTGETPGPMSFSRKTFGQPPNSQNWRCYCIISILLDEANGLFARKSVKCFPMKKRWAKATTEHRRLKISTYSYSSDLKIDFFVKYKSISWHRHYESNLIANFEQ